MCLAHGKVTSDSLREYRKSNEVFVTAKRGGNSVQNSTSKISQEIAFGKPTRIQTPLKGVMTNDYGNYAKVKAHERYLKSDLVSS